MSDSILSSPWKSLARETCLFWARRHSTILRVITLATAAAALMVAIGHRSGGEGILIEVAFFAPLIGGLLTMSGIVADERDSGIMVLWFQKPGSLFRCYAIRYLLYQGLLLAFAATIAILLCGISAMTGVMPPAKALRVGAVILLLALIPAAMVFAASSWGIRRDSTVAFIVIMASVTAGGAFAFDDSALAHVVRVVVFPMDSMQAISDWPRYGTDLSRPLGIIAGQLLAWTSAGFLGLRFTEWGLRRNG